MTPQTRPRTIASVRLNGARLNGRIASRIHAAPPRRGKLEPMVVHRARRIPIGPICIGLALFALAYFAFEMMRGLWWNR